MLVERLPDLSALLAFEFSQKHLLDHFVGLSASGEALAVGVQTLG